MSDAYNATYFNETNYDPTAYNNDADVMPTTGAKNGVKLKDLRGVDFRGVMHAFSGSYETYRRLLTYADFRFGIGGVVTYKNAGVALAVEKMSLDDIVTETDCPWLTPVPFRGKRNEPSYVRLVVEKIAQIKQLPYEDVAASTTRNARRLFNL